MLAETFYNQLPKNKIELVDGQTLISGSREVSRMVLAAILQGYGAEYIVSLVEPALLQEACIEAFGRKKRAGSDSVMEETPYMPVARMAGELRMNLFALRRFDVMGGDQVVKLSEEWRLPESPLPDAFTPDIYVNRIRHDPRQKEYYFEGAPDLIIEVMHPATKAFDTGLRLMRYQAASVPEIWLIDAASENIMVYRLQGNSYSFQTLKAEETLDCQVLPGLTLYPSRLWQVKADPWKNYYGLVSFNEASSREDPAQIIEKGRVDMESSIRIPFAPEIHLTPTPISFEQFISWAPEAKFEWMDGKPHIGGGTDTNLYLTGLLLMTLGLTESVGILPAEDWKDYL